MGKTYFKTKPHKPKADHKKTLRGPNWPSKQTPERWGLVRPSPNLGCGAVALKHPTQRVPQVGGEEKGTAPTAH